MVERLSDLVVVSRYLESRPEPRDRLWVWSRGKSDLCVVNGKVLLARRKWDC